MEFSVQRLVSWESSLGFGVTIQDLFAHSHHENQSILKEISPEYSLEGLMLKLKLHPVHWPPDAKNQLIGKDSDAGND